MSDFVGIRPCVVRGMVGCSIFLAPIRTPSATSQGRRSIFATDADTSPDRDLRIDVQINACHILNQLSILGLLARSDISPVLLVETREDGKHEIINLQPAAMASQMIAGSMSLVTRVCTSNTPAHQLNQWLNSQSLAVGSIRCCIWRMAKGIAHHLQDAGLVEIFGYASAADVEGIAVEVVRDMGRIAHLASGWAPSSCFTAASPIMSDFAAKTDLDGIFMRDLVVEPARGGISLSEADGTISAIGFAILAVRRVIIDQSMRPILSFIFAPWLKPLVQELIRYDPVLYDFRHHALYTSHDGQPVLDMGVIFSDNRVIDASDPSAELQGRIDQAYERGMNWAIPINHVPRQHRARLDQWKRIASWASNGAVITEQAAIEASKDIAHLRPERLESFVIDWIAEANHRYDRGNRLPSAPVWKAIYQVTFRTDAAGINIIESIPGDFASSRLLPAPVTPSHPVAASPTTPGNMAPVPGVIAATVAASPSPARAAPPSAAAAPIAGIAAAAPAAVGGHYDPWTAA